MKKILLNAIALNNEFTGVQYYSENLFRAISAIKHDKLDFEILLSNSYTGEIVDSTSLKVKNVDFSSHNRLKRFSFDNFSLPHYCQKNNFSLLHSPNYTLPYIGNNLSVLTVHDIISLQYPEFCKTKSVIYHHLLLKRSIKKASKIIAVSNKVKEDILNVVNISPQKIEVIYHGVADHFFKIKSAIEINRVKNYYSLPDRYILFVGNIEPKKNLERLIRAFYKLRCETDITHKLLIVGKKGWKCESVFRIVESLNMKEDVLFTGYIPEADISIVYTLASVFVFPSLYEGFGIPPLEAMACQVPVLVSTAGSLPEVTGGNCMQVNPYDIHEIASGIYSLLNDHNLQQKLKENGTEWVRRFTWELAAEKTIHAYEQILGLA